MARYRDDQAVELWRGRYHLSENAILSFVGGMNQNWSHWIDTPMRDDDSIGRRFAFDRFTEAPTTEEEIDLGEMTPVDAIVTGHVARAMEAIA